MSVQSTEWKEANVKASANKQHANNKYWGKFVDPYVSHSFRHFYRGKVQHNHTDTAIAHSQVAAVLYTYVKQWAKEHALFDFVLYLF